MLALQSLRIESTKLDAPKADGFVTDRYATFSQEIFDIAVAEVESVVQPDLIADDIGWESVTFVGIHPEIIHFRGLSCQYHRSESTSITTWVFSAGERANQKEVTHQEQRSGPKDRLKKKLKAQPDAQPSTVPSASHETHSHPDDRQFRPALPKHPARLSDRH
jgi:hypothetical protein